jgi:hypothetical protein
MVLMQRPLLMRPLLMRRLLVGRPKLSRNLLMRKMVLMTVEMALMRGLVLVVEKVMAIRSWMLPPLFLVVSLMPGTAMGFLDLPQRIVMGRDLNLRVPRTPCLPGAMVTDLSAVCARGLGLGRCVTGVTAPLAMRPCLSHQSVDASMNLRSLCPRRR